jgi:hypothetical protein
LINVNSMCLPPSTRNTSDFRFAHYVEPSCSNSSAFSEYNAITLRAGLNTYTTHTTGEVLQDRIANEPLTSNKTFIFYNIEITPSYEIEQLSIVSTNGEHIDLFSKTFTRRNNSLLVGFPPVVHMLITDKPKDALETFIVWVNRILYRHTNHSGSECDVVLVAHDGMCRDHVQLLC